MAVVKLRTHHICYEIITGSYTDSNGDFHQGTKRWSEPIKCDAVPSSGKASIINYKDGVAREFSFICYLGKEEHRFELGEKILLVRDSETYELDVKGYQPYQHQAKLWV